MKLYDDVLDKEANTYLEEIMLRSKEFPWYFSPDNLYSNRLKDYNTDCFYFIHNFVIKGEINSDHFYLVKPLIEYVEQRHDIEGVLRIKANLYTNQHTNIKYGQHVDQEGLEETNCYIGVYNVISCDGGTWVGGTTYPSISNQLLLFDNVSHYGITQTDTQTRICINFNFKRKQ